GRAHLDDATADTSSRPPQTPLRSTRRRPEVSAGRDARQPPDRPPPQAHPARTLLSTNSDVQRRQGHRPQPPSPNRDVPPRARRPAAPRQLPRRATSSTPYEKRHLAAIYRHI